MFLKFNLYPILWGILILVLSLLPGKDLPTISFWGILSFDKAAHMFFYAVFIFLMVIGFIKQHAVIKLRYHSIKYAIIFGMIFGIFIELLQGMIMPDRFADIMDIFANFIGCVLGSAVFSTVYFGIK